MFDVMKYYDGLLLRIPSRKNPEKLEEMVHQEKMLEIFREHHRWQEIVGLGTVGDFNKCLPRGADYGIDQRSRGITGKEDRTYCR